MSPSRSLRLIVNWAIPVLIPCFLAPRIVTIRDSEPSQDLLHPRDQHLILAEYYILAGA